jgi:calcium binding protein 39
MNALRDRSRSIQFEAFHIFKIFAANPNKHPEVRKRFAFHVLL